MQFGLASCLSADYLWWSGRPRTEILWPCPQTPLGMDIETRKRCKLGKATWEVGEGGDRYGCSEYDTQGRSVANPAQEMT